MHRTKIIAAILILIPCVLIALKFSYWNYTFKNINEEPIETPIMFSYRI
jgi:hypothetical protein